MCGPMAVPIAMLAITAVSTAFSINSQIQAGKAQKKMFDNAAAAKRAEGAIAQENLKRRRDIIMGRTVAAYGAAGVDLDGTPMDVLMDQASEFGKQSYDIDLGVRTETDSLLDSGRNAMWNARNQAVGTLLNFGAKASSIVGGMGAGSAVPTGADQIGPAMNNISTGVGSSPY
jgi:type II secretory pathway pseudopilin PulG